MLPFTNGELPVPSRALFIGADPHADLATWPEIVGWQPLKPRANAWERGGFTLVDKPTGRWPMILMLPGKSRDETLAWFAMAHDLLEPGGTLLVSMANTAGAGRFEKELATAAGNISSLQKHKCRAFHAKAPSEWNKETLTEWRKLGERRVLPDSQFTTEAGIFSADHIDPGSRLLASHFPASLRGKAADLGAGWGFLTDAALKRCPGITSIDLFEADARALDCARLNLAQHDCGIGFHWHDVTTGLPESYDTIVMNPPFHTGQATDVDLGRAFLRVAAKSLNRGGKLHLVANRQLPYEAELTALGLSWRKVAEDSVFKILSAERR